jgi:hypothetical protein
MKIDTEKAIRIFIIPEKGTFLFVFTFIFPVEIS